MSIWYKLQNIDRRILYLLLIVASSVPLLFQKLILPTECKDPAIMFYEHLMRVPEGGTIFLESDWTNSTRGENAGQLEAVLRILHARKIKFVLYSLVDPQAPRVARDIIFEINEELIRNGQKPFEKWNDWVDARYFPDAASFLTTLVLNLRKALASDEDTDPSGKLRNILESPVLKNIRRIEDLGMLICITGTGSVRSLVERLGQPPKVPLGAMITGVMGPETLNFFTARQVSGAVIGLQGTVELETMMRYGVNVQDADGITHVRSNLVGRIPPTHSRVTFARGMNYYLSLHVALALVMLAIIVGNVGILVTRRRKR